MMYHLAKAILLVAAVLFMANCKQRPIGEESAKPMVSVPKVNGIPATWIHRRVQKAKERLQGSEAGQVVWKAMEAHGGLKQWYANGALAMRFNYQPLDGSTQRDTYQIVDVWNNRSLHTSMRDSTASYGWTGSTAWIKAKDSTHFAYDTKFWAMTPLYLMGFPFVLDGEGVNLELLPDSNYKETSNKVVKVTFDAGTGDAPDDYYILHFDAQTNVLIGTRYIVSYPAYFKDGGHSPEKFMEVGPLVNVDGVLLPSELKTHWTVNGLPGEYLTHIVISDYGFVNDLDSDFFEMPDGADTL